MPRKFLHFLLLTALVAASSLALADPPAVVGRISAAEGRVTLQTEDGEESGSLLNWPVTTDQHLRTASGARAEFRVGAVAVRLDGDSDISIEQLDDDNLRLRLNYGAASVRVPDPQALAGFELTTPQARVLLTEPGTVRVDTEREPDTTIVSVLDGVGRVEAAGTALTLRADRRAEIRGEDVLTSQARQDAFDAWAVARDRRGAAAIATRYIPRDVTGYEELDHYGTWTVNDDYGPLWAPTVIASDWAPYRDGRWTWLSPWGWTWVDNAPWGYAPSHYGRWVMVNRRWCWSPDRVIGRPAWSPAVVGWVGGAGWAVSFNDRRRGPGMGWYPLSPRDRYTPHYQVSPAYERRLGWQYRGNEKWGNKPVQPGRRDGITIVPREQFEQRRTVRVNNVPRATVAPNPGNLPATAPIVPGGVRDGGRGGDRNRDGIPDRAQTPGRPQQQPDRIRETIADRPQTDRNRDGIVDRLQTERPRENIGNRPQNDRNRDGIVDRLQTERPPIDRPQNDRGQFDRDRNRDGIADRPRPGQNTLGTAAPQQPNRPQVLQTAPAAPAVAPRTSQELAERGERRREAFEQRADQRREMMESRRQQQVQQQQQAQQQHRPEPQQPRPQPQQQPQQPQQPQQFRPQPQQQAAPRPAPSAPAAAPRPAQPQQGGPDRGGRGRESER